MKKFLAILLLAVTVPAMAQHYHHHHHGHHGHWARHDGGWGWVAPMVIGGAVVYAATRPAQPVIVQQTPPPVVYQQQNCSPWTQIQNADGTTTMTRTCYGVQ